MPFDKDKKKIERQRTIRIDEEIEKTKKEIKKRLELLFIDIDPQLNTIRPKQLKLHFKTRADSGFSPRKLLSQMFSCFSGNPSYQLLDDSVWLNERESGETLHRYKNFRGFSLKDFGVQSARKHKWMRTLDSRNISVLVVMIDLLWYEQFYSDEGNHQTSNKMLKCIEFVEQVESMKAFKETDILLYFYNKEEFMRRLKVVGFKECFSEYEGGDTFEEASEYLDNLLGKDRTGSSTYAHYLDSKEIGDDVNMRFLMSTSVWLLIRSMMKVYHML